MAVALNRIGQIALPTSDVERSGLSTGRRWGSPCIASSSPERSRHFRAGPTMAMQPKPQALKRSREAALAELKRVLLAERAERLRAAGLEDRAAIDPDRETRD